MKDLVRQALEGACMEWAREKGATVESRASVEIPPPNIPGDYASNFPLSAAKALGAPPREVAAALVKRLSSNPLFERVDVAGPGFLNFFLKTPSLAEELRLILANGGQARRPAKRATRVLVEFVSANPTGPLHVGHGRGAALGDSLARIFRRQGYDVTTEFYVNDAGGQIRMLGRSVEARFRELAGENVVFPEDGYKGGYVRDLAVAIRESGLSLAAVDERQMVFSDRDFAGWASRRLLAIIQKTLNDFGVGFDRWYSESELHGAGAVQKLIADMRSRELAYEQEGAIWFRAASFGDEKDRVLQKANEAPTYFAADLAYHLGKLARGYDRLINIWGADHHGYAQRLKGALAALGQPAEKLQVVFNQLISIKGGRLSKRAGDMITLQELIDEVGRDATRFFFALRSPGSQFEFDLDLAKKQASDNPVFYVKYVHARCASIFREAEKRGITAGNFEFPPELAPAERSLVLRLAGFGDVLDLCLQDLSPHHLTDYLLKLAGEYHRFYETCRVLDDNPQVAAYRLALVGGVRTVIREGLSQLAVEAPDTM